MLNGIKKPHFIGVGGVGMSAIAFVLKKMGYEVSGSDAVISTLTDHLRREGVDIYIGHARENLPKDADAVVLSSAIKSDNPELIEAKRRGIKVLHRSDMLAAILNRGKGVAVAGAHGKTTTTSMLSCIAYSAGLEPTVLIGGEVKALGGNAIYGKSDWVLAEADESDGSFLKFFPYISIITNVENDHMDHYGSMDNMKAAFRQYISQTNAEGCVVLCFDDEFLRAMAKETDRHVISYAIDNEADYQAKNIVYSYAVTTYEVYYKGEKIADMRIKVPGKHNVENSLAVIAAARCMGIDIKDITRIFTDFSGAKRRFELKGEVGGVMVVDDYAHHPSEIKSTLAAAKQVKRNRLVTVFQPHRYTRTQNLKEEFGKSFSDCDIIILTDIYAASEEPIDGIDGQTLVKSVKAGGRKDVVYLPDLAAVTDYLLENARPGDLVLTMGAGDIYKAGESYLEKKRVSDEK